jgi:hypothetical protein
LVIGGRGPGDVTTVACDRSIRLATAEAFPFPTWAKTPSTTPSHAQVSTIPDSAIRMIVVLIGADLHRFQNLNCPKPFEAIVMPIGIRRKD